MDVTAIAVDLEHGDYNTPSGLINYLWMNNPDSKPFIIENDENEK